MRKGKMRKEKKSKRKKWKKWNKRIIPCQLLNRLNEN
jgi:hypothetical protein